MDATNWNMNLKTSLKSFITSMKYVQLSKHIVKFACRRSVENRQVAMGSCKMRKWENAKVTKYKMRIMRNIFISHTAILSQFCALLHYVK